MDVMRRFLGLAWITLALAAVRLTAEAPAAVLPRFADPAVNAFVDEADAAARKAAPLSPEFWAWVERHPEIRCGLLFAKHPMPSVHAENLDLLRRALRPDQADRYAHLLLGIAVSSESPIRTEAQQARAEFSPAVRKVAAWMRSGGVSYQRVMEDTAAALAASGVTAAEAKEPGFWALVAHASGTYPERLANSVTEHVRWLADRLDAPAPEGGKQPWPAFPMAKAPWPLLTWFRDVPPAREREWIWSYYWAKLPGQSKSGIIGYGRYSWDYDRKPEVKHKPSEWHPSSLPRIWEDGGVCGRLSTMGDTFRRTLGIPARGAGQPGHRAFVSYGWDARQGKWTFGVGQSISGLDSTSTSPELPPLRPFQQGRAVNCVAVVSAMNLGLERFHRARILGWYALTRAPEPARDRYLRQALALNPYELGLWKALADGVSDAPAAGRLLAEMDRLVLTPNSRLEEAVSLSASTDFATLGGGKPEAKADRGADVARLAGDALALEMFERLFRAGGSPTELRATVREELARRAALKVPHGPAVADGLVARLDLRVEGLQPFLAAARDAALAADKLKGKPRDAALASLAQRLSALRDSDPNAVAEWCAGLKAALEAAGPRWLPDKAGVAKADPLYAQVHDLHVHQLRRQGKPAAAKLAAIQRTHEAGRAAAAPPASASPPK